jgi:hypothetical protein
LDRSVKPRFKPGGFAMMRWGLLLAGIVLIQAPPASGGEKSRPPSAKEIKALIDQLVSPNPAPIIDGTRNRLPSGFDLKKQEQVHRAVTKLKQLGPRAFPFLIERWGDQRYCLSTCVAASDNHTVGVVCHWIIFDQLAPYGSPPVKGYLGRPPRVRPNYIATFLGSQESARQWWGKNQHKTLRQMQLEVLDWVIVEETKRSQDFKDGDREHLQDIRKNLAQSRKALPPGSSFDPSYASGGK